MTSPASSHASQSARPAPLSASSTAIRSSEGTDRANPVETHPSDAKLAPRPASPSLTGSPFAVNPARLRLALLVLVGVYPLITLLSYGVGLFTANWQIWQRGLVITPLMVACMVFGLIPFIQSRFGRFIATGRW